MKLTFLDFETFWSQTHTLSKMSPVEYAMHPDTQLISCSLKVDDGPTDVAFGEHDIRRLLDTVDWSDAYGVAHNMSAFDAMILSWRLGYKPRMWGCTLAMARPLHAKTVGLSLAALTKHYNLGVKDNTALINTRGKRLEDFTAAELDAMRVYNRDDTDLCAALFHKLRPHYTPKELWHLDCNIRMLVEPQFDLDTGLLETALSVERSNKHAALMTLARMLRERGHDGPITWDDEDAVAEWVREQMASAPKFSAILESRDVDVPMKWSKTDPSKRIPAIAKTDEAMELLLEHDDELVSAAARARLSAKSTQLETRIQSFLDTYRAVGRLPVPVQYCGADTTGRDSGFLYNMLNLPRINPDKPKVSDALRRSVRAPKGKVVLVQDLSGIELRVNHTLWKVARSMNGWAANPRWDLYRDTAAQMYTCRVEDVEKSQRHYAKVLELACGYQQGGATFRQTARIQGGLRLTLAQAKEGVKFWRSRYPEIADYDTGGWAKCQESLHYIAEGTERAIDPWGFCVTEKNAIRLPSGRRILYPDLRLEEVVTWKTYGEDRVAEKEQAWVYATGRHRAFIYGGKCTENIVQAMARDIIFDHALQFFKKTKLRPVHKVYDELVYIVDPAAAEDLSAQLAETMRARLSWWPELTLWSEGDIAQTYGDAK